MRFGAAAGSYDDHAEVQREVAAWCAEWLPPPSSSRSWDVLELGAGTGLMTRHLVAQPHLRVTATDNCPQMIQVGKARVPDARWLKLDAWEPDLEASDLLVASSLLQWAPDPVAVLRAWRKLARPDGRLLTTFFVLGSLKEFADAAPSLSALRWHSEAEWRDFLRAAGWQILRESTWTTVQRFSSGPRALRSVHRTGAVLASQTPAAELRRALRAYESRYRDEDGQVPLSWRALRIEATPQE